MTLIIFRSVRIRTNTKRKKKQSLAAVGSKNQNIHSSHEQYANVRAIFYKGRTASSGSHTHITRVQYLFAEPVAASATRITRSTVHPISEDMYGPNLLIPFIILYRISCESQQYFHFAFTQTCATHHEKISNKYIKTSSIKKSTN